MDGSGEKKAKIGKEQKNAGRKGNKKTASFYKKKQGGKRLGEMQMRGE